MLSIRLLDLPLLINLTSIDPVNYFENEHNLSILRPNKRSTKAEDLSRQQKLQISLNYNEADGSAYPGDEHNSSITFASGSMTATPSILMLLGHTLYPVYQNSSMLQSINI